MMVPPLPINRGVILNAAGWPDPMPEGMFTCKTCKKQLQATFLGLVIFPSFKAGLDLFQFTYRMPEHESGDAFGNETCKESGTNVTRDFERPTSMRFLAGDKMTTGSQGKEPAQAAESAPGESKEDPLAILNIRLAKGEITQEEFERLAKTVGAGGNSAQEAAQEELKRKLDSLSPQMAEERYKYLSSRPIGELTDAEYDERLALAQKVSGKHSKAP